MRRDGGDWILGLKIYLFVFVCVFFVIIDVWFVFFLLVIDRIFVFDVCLFSVVCSF